MFLDNKLWPHLGYEVYMPTLEMLPKFSYTAFNLQQIEELTAKFNDETIKGNPKLFPLRNLIFQIAVTCSELFISCYFSGEKFECCEKFKVSYSEQGFCYSFNGRYYGEKDGEWVVEYHRDSNHRIPFLEQKTQNYRDCLKLTQIAQSVSLSAARPKFSFIRSKKFSATTIEPSFYGSRVFLSTCWSTWSRHTQPKTPNSFQLVLSRNGAGLALRNFHVFPAQRKCIFEGEEKLTYYDNDIYSATACMKECRMNKALKLCKCVPPFYASKSVSKSPQCWVTNLVCLKQNQKEITSNEGCEKCQLNCLTTVYESERFRKKYCSTILRNPWQTEERISFPA